MRERRDDRGPVLPSYHFTSWQQPGYLSGCLVIVARSQISPATVSSCHRRQQWKLKLFSSINSLVASLGLCPTLSLTSHNRDSPQNLLLSSLWHGGSSAANPLKINNINKISFLALVIPFQYKDTVGLFHFRYI